MAENVFAPPQEFRKLMLSKREFQADSYNIDVYTLYARALVSDSLLHMLPFFIKKKEI